MTMIVPNFDVAVVVREADAEALGWMSLSCIRQWMNHSASIFGKRANRE